MEIWFGAGDETGNWDMLDGQFRSDCIGVAWVLGDSATWERALQQEIDGIAALEVFSTPIANRVADSDSAAEASGKYHVIDVWRRFRHQTHDIPIGEPNEDPWLERIRRDAAWLINDSGLGVLVVSGTPADARAAGLGRSGDGLRERARAFAGLMTVALPFLPGGASLNLLVEGRTESLGANAVALSGNNLRVEGSRSLEPYRDFIGRLREDLGRSAERCAAMVAEGTIADRFFCGGRSLIGGFLSNSLRGYPFLSTHADASVQAMNGIADLAAAFAPRPEGKGCRLLLPGTNCGRIWVGNFRDLRHALDY